MGEDIVADGWRAYSLDHHIISANIVPLLAIILALSASAFTRGEGGMAKERTVWAGVVVDIVVEGGTIGWDGRKDDDCVVDIPDAYEVLLILLVSIVLLLLLFAVPHEGQKLLLYTNKHLAHFTGTGSSFFLRLLLLLLLLLVGGGTRESEGGTETEGETFIEIMAGVGREEREEGTGRGSGSGGGREGRKEAAC